MVGMWLRIIRKLSPGGVNCSCGASLVPKKCQDLAELDLNVGEMTRTDLGTCHPPACNLPSVQAPTTRRCSEPKRCPPPLRWRDFTTKCCLRGVLPAGLAGFSPGNVYSLSRMLGHGLELCVPALLTAGRAWPRRCVQACVESKNHSIIAWFGWEGTFRGHLVQRPCNE